MSSLKVTPP